MENVKSIPTLTFYKSWLINADGSINNDYKKEVKDSFNNPCESVLRIFNREFSSITNFDFLVISRAINKKYNLFDICLGFEIKIKVGGQNNKYNIESIVTLTYIITEKNKSVTVENDIIVVKTAKISTLYRQLVCKLELIMRYYCPKDKYVLENKNHQYNILFNHESAAKLLHEVLSHAFEDDFYDNSTIYKQIDGLFNKSLSLSENYNTNNEIDDVGNEIIKDYVIIERGKNKSSLISSKSGNKYIDFFAKNKKAYSRTSSSLFQIHKKISFTKIFYPLIKIDEISMGAYNNKTNEIILWISKATISFNKKNLAIIDSFKMILKIQDLLNKDIYYLGNLNTSYSLCQKLGAIKFVEITNPPIYIKSVNFSVMEVEQ